MPPVCSCKKHNEINKNEQSKVYKIASKKYKKCVLEALQTADYLCERALYLCTGCANYAEQCLLKQSYDENEQKINEVIELIKNKKVSNCSVKKLIKTIVECELPHIQEDLCEIQTQYKNDNFLQTVNVHEWLKGRNSVVTTFLLAISNYDIQNISSDDCSLIAFGVESVYSLLKRNVVLPFSFAKNLLSYYLCSNKVICTLNASCGPAGSYSTILNWISDHSLSHVNVSSSSDVITFFDNNQVLARNWRVHYDAKAILSAITTVVHFFPFCPTEIQQKAELSPRHWLYSNFSFPKQSILSAYSHYSTLFRDYRKSFISERISLIMKEQLPGHDGFFDLIDSMLGNKRKKRKNEESSHEKSKIKHDPYNSIPHFHAGPPSIMVGNPISKNPCSSEAVKDVIEALKDATQVPSVRSWTVIGCDGLPYVIASRILREHQHLHDILLLPGQGHWEMNMTKGLIKLVWEVVGEDLAKLLGYKSPKALQSCLEGNDHHKAFQFCEILLFGTADELLYPYISDCFKNETEPSARGYFKWASDVADCNYKFLQEVIFTYTLAIYVFRCGIRRNNADAILCGRLKFSPLFYGLNKTNYQQMEIYDLMMRFSAPEEVKSFLRNNESLSQSGHPSKGEGCDFILESKNKMIKRWLPPGAPKEKHWRQTCSNLDRLEKIRENLYQCFGLSNEEDQNIYHTNLQKEIQQWRLELRDTEYLMTPMKESKPLSILNKDLDHDLVIFSINCKNNLTLYLQECSENNTVKPLKLNPIFIIPEDRKNFHSIERKTKSEIANLIQEELQRLEKMDYELGIQQQQLYTKVKNEKKAILIKFYKDVKAVVEHIESRDAEDNDDEEFVSSCLHPQQTLYQQPDHS